MKKILTIFILAFTVFSLIACSTNTSTNSDTGVSTTQNQVIRVGMDLRYPPFEMVDFDNNHMGISVDIANEFGEYIGAEVEIVNTNFSALIPALNSGSIDIIIASMSITEEREQSVDFTDPYFYFKIISLVNKDFANAN